MENERRGRRLDLVYFVRPRTIADFETTYTAVADAGIHSVVLAAQMGNLNLRLREHAAGAGVILNRLGLSSPACHGVELNLNEADGDLRARMIREHLSLMENVADLACRTYVCHLGKAPQDGPKDAARDRVLRALDEFAPRAESLGLIIALENGFAGYLVTNAELLSLVAEYAHPAVQVCYDSGHAHMVGDAAAALVALSPCAVTVHLHDNNGAEDQHLIPGQGAIDWPAVVAALGRCPRLMHVETEAFNADNWKHEDVCARYCDVLNEVL